MDQLSCDTKDEEPAQLELPGELVGSCLAPRSSSMAELRRLPTGLEARKLHVGVAACGTLAVILLCSLSRAFGGLLAGTRSYEQ